MAETAKPQDTNTTGPPTATGRANAAGAAQTPAATASPGPRKAGFRPDFATLGGMALALAGILGGLILEKGSLQDVAQATAFMIVIGGTLGAVLVTTPLSI